LFIQIFAMIAPIVDFKNVKKQDAKLIREIALDAWIDTYKPILSKEQLNYMFEKWYSIVELEKLIDSKEQIFTIAYYNKIAIGFAAYSIVETSKFKLNKIYVLPAYQGKKLGASLLIEIETVCKHNGAKILQLNVNRFNKAKDFYLAMGYKIIAEDDIPIGDYFMNDYIMEKNLE
jgi:GNAT superfamily N-acetyltransferase